MHVLLFAGQFQVRGSCAYTLRLAKHLGEYGISTRITCADARFIDPRNRSGVSIKEYPYLTAPGWGRVVRELLYRDVCGEPPDVIHIQSRYVVRQGLWLAGKLRRPVILTLHDYLPSRERLPFHSPWARRIIAVSDSVKSDLLSQIRLPEELVTVIPGGVEAAEHSASPPVLASSHVPVIGTAGPLESIKGLPFFLEAAQKVLAAGRDVEFLIAGAGPEEAKLRRLARNLGITPHITFVPNVLDFTTSLAAMDIFCLPSLQQGLGTIMLDAMAMAKPVIATRVGGVYGIVRDGLNGLVVPPSNSEALAEKMLELLDDPDRARTLATTAHRMVHEKFPIEKTIRETAEVYRQVLAEQSSPAREPNAARA